MDKILHLLLIICVLSCAPYASDYLIGKWQILSIHDNGEPILLTDNWMHLKADGKFISFDKALDRTENGNWKYQTDKHQLSIDSKVSSSWIMSIKNDTLKFLSTEGEVYLLAIKIGS